MRLERLLDRIRSRGDEPCLVDGDTTVSGASLDAIRCKWLDVLARERIAPGSSVALGADFSPDAIGLLLALFTHRCVAMLLPPDRSRAAAEHAAYHFELRRDGSWNLRHASDPTRHALLERLRERRSPGFVIYTSGSSGEPKAALHDLDRFLIKFDRANKSHCTLAFLRLDHIAGMDTLFYTLSAGGSLVLPDGHDPDSVCRRIEAHGVEVLPVSPTFLNLLCLSGAADRHDLDSLRIVTYGSEPMSAATLDRLGQLLPEARLVQKYGTSEFGSPRALSRARDSLWIRFKDDEVETRIRDGLLWVRTRGAMLGYLNAPDPFDDDGWLCTGDEVERDGDWVRILGRRSDVINVGGEKVHPAEVESVLMELDFVSDAVVRGEPHALTGRIVTAEVSILRPMTPHEVRREVRRHCRGRLAPHQVPVKVLAHTGPIATRRHKKDRRESRERLPEPNAAG